MNLIGSDIQAQQDFFEALVTADPGLNGFLFESGQDTDQLYEATQTGDLAYPALVLFAPEITIDDNGYGLLDAKQDNAFAVLFAPTDNGHQEQNTALKLAQLAAFRITKELRKAAKEGRFRIDLPVRWRYRPMYNVGPNRACGWMVDYKIITNANALIGV